VNAQRRWTLSLRRACVTGDEGVVCSTSLLRRRAPALSGHTIPWRARTRELAACAGGSRAAFCSIWDDAPAAGSLYRSCTDCGTLKERFVIGFRLAEELPCLAGLWLPGLPAGEPLLQDLGQPSRRRDDGQVERLSCLQKPHFPAAMQGVCMLRTGAPGCGDIATLRSGKFDFSSADTGRTTGCRQKRDVDGYSWRRHCRVLPFYSLHRYSLYLACLWRGCFRRAPSCALTARR